MQRRKAGLNPREIRLSWNPPAGILESALAMVVPPHGGYRCVFDDAGNDEQGAAILLKAYGAELILTPGPEGDGRRHSRRLRN